MKIARVIEEHKTNYIIMTDEGEFTATVRGSFFTGDTFPKVGDFVSYDAVAEGKAVIAEVQPRTSAIIRKGAADESAQVIVTNVDIIFIVMGLDNDFNLSRLERYLLLAKQSDVAAVVVLNKSDVVADCADYITQTEKVALQTPVCVVSALTGQGMEALLSYLTPHTTDVLLGSSGSGKSTITNWLLRADTQLVCEVRGDDSRGRHTTTSRQLFAIPTGGYVIDTPGMRELGIVESTSDDENAVFTVIEMYSQQCQFTNCDHEKSNGCAVLAAIEDGEITKRQLQSYLKLQRERLFEESKQGEVPQWQQKKRKKQLLKTYNNALKKKYFDTRS